MRIPFSRPDVSAAAGAVLTAAVLESCTPGRRAYIGRCHYILQREVGSGRPFLTSSCTDALEMAMMVLGIAPGDEVVMPSWTFPSTANAVALRGAVPVFVDVVPETLDIDPAKVANALTSRTRAVICVHYAGVACDMEALRSICADARVALVEDAAQGYGATWRGRMLGGLGDLGAFSFHSTKNVSCGEGGALLVNRDDLSARAEIAWEKGTNRLSFLRNETSFYDWCDLGSSFAPSEITAALLSVQLDETARITAARRKRWARYAELLRQASCADRLTTATVPNEADHNGHVFFVQARRTAARDAIMADLAAHGIDARLHYRPLHSSSAGRRLGRTCGSMAATDAAGDGLIRLPLDTLITAAEQQEVVDVLIAAARRAD